MTSTKKSLFYFFALTFAISWLMWLPGVLDSQGVGVPGFFLMVGMAANFGPFFAAFICLKKGRSPRDVWDDVKGLHAIPFKTLWLLPVLLVFPLLTFLSIAISWVPFLGVRATVTAGPLQWLMMALPIMVIGGPLGEELGWRGYAMPRLLSLYTPFIASLILGVLWSFWHLPLVFIQGTVQSGIPFWQFGLQNTLVCFIYTWFYLKTKGNLSVMILLHTLGNLTAASTNLWFSNEGRWLSFGVNLVFVLILLVWERRVFFQRG